MPRRGVTPSEVITAGHQTYQWAVREEAPQAVHIERSYVPVKDRVRPMRGLQTIATGQQLVEGLTVVQAIRQGNVAVRGGGRPSGGCPHQRALAAVTTCQWLAGELRLAS